MVVWEGGLGEGAGEEEEEEALRRPMVQGWRQERCAAVRSLSAVRQLVTTQPSANDSGSGSGSSNGSGSVMISSSSGGSS